LAGDPSEFRVFSTLRTGQFESPIFAEGLTNERHRLAFN